MSQLRVLVTGGGRGIGRAIALRFAREKAKVTVCARSSPELDAVIKEIDAAGGLGRAQQMDVADHGSVEAAVWRAVEFLDGAIDVLVNNAGMYEIQSIEKMDIAMWNRMIAVNLSGAFYVTNEALDPLFEGTRPHVFNVASVAGRQGFEGHTAYCASKYGLRGFSDALRLDLVPKGVRVSTVYPGPTDTAMAAKLPSSVDRSKLGKPEGVAEVIWRAYNAPTGTNVDDLDVP